MIKIWWMMRQMREEDRRILMRLGGLLECWPRVIVFGVQARLCIPLYIPFSLMNGSFDRTFESRMIIALDVDIMNKLQQSFDNASTHQQSPSKRGR
ncbi:hypothetical protein EYC84_001622 [Monilinia fructicola]|uniref:Uncharacterized protein n=1 Tax=Monilinia fructicola TaxID=38448 RepID=A0A5M9JSF2_MONFR|nr:hypothetical protein EYC84_001622 [Monilinia fructicola]